jgi:hypothetical protein
VLKTVHFEQQTSQKHLGVLSEKFDIVT